MATIWQKTSHVTRMYVCIIINILVLYFVHMASADITVMNFKNYTTAYFEDRAAEFGPNLFDEEILGYLVYVNPRNACHSVAPPLQDTMTGVVWIALIARGGCEFAQKVINAQYAGYGAAIVHNYKGRDDLLPMGGGSMGPEVNIPAVFVGNTDGENLAEKYCYLCEKAKKGYYHVKLEENSDGDANNPYLLWPFAVVVGTCFVFMLFFMIFKWCRDVRRRKTSRLSTKHLKKVPVKKFKKGDAYDVCAICLDDYEEGEKLRVLPCSHAYHCKCIDPWLTKSKRTCPVCKRKVFPGDADSDSESDNEAGGSTSVSERTPLLAGPSSGRELNTRPSTFDNSGLSEAARSQVRSANNENRTFLSGDEESDSDSDTSPDLGAVVRSSRNGEEEMPNFVVIESGSARVNDAFTSNSDDITFAGESNTEGTQLSQVV